MMRERSGLLVATCSAFALTVNAAAPSEEKRASDEDMVCRASPPNYMVPAACAEPPRLRSYDPVYLIYQKTDGDDNALRLHYSLRYTLFAPDCLPEFRASLASARADKDEKSAATRKAQAAKKMQICMDRLTDRRYEIYMMFTGEFDFYMETRESGPVVNRISNPGIHYRRRIAKKEDIGEYVRPQWWDIGVEHRSNGQTTDRFVLDPVQTNRRRAAVEFERGNRDYIDSISQDTNFVVFESNFKIGESLELWARLKPFYFSNDSGITWGPMAAENPQIEDYDRVRLLVAYRIGDASRKLSEQWKLYADWTYGDRGFKTDSVNVGAYLPFKLCGLHIPFYVRAHHGPMHTLSDFSRKQNSVGFGLLLLP